jgi:hypothetical protein
MIIILLHMGIAGNNTSKMNLVIISIKMQVAELIQQ